MAGEALAAIRRGYTLDDLRAAAPPAVAATVLVQTVPSLAETGEFLATAAGSGGLIAGVVGWADLTQLDATLDRLPGGRLVGLRHQVEDEPDPRWLLRPGVRRGLATLGPRGIVYDLLVRAPQRPAALATARALDEVRFVLDHAGKPAIASGEWQPWASWIDEIAECPNVMCKLSGLLTQARWDGWDAATIRPYAAHVWDRFGADRVMFGSDWPVCELAARYDEVLTLTEDLLDGASPDERAAVLGRNATRWYGLNVAA